MHPVLALYQRGAWANRKVQRACAALDRSMLQRGAPAPFGALAATLHHIVRGEQDYLQRLTDHGRGEWVVSRPIGPDRLAALVRRERPHAAGREQ